MPIEFLIFLTVFTPALVGGLNLIFNKNPNVRDTVTLAGALITFYFSANIFLVLSIKAPRDINSAAFVKP